MAITLRQFEYFLALTEAGQVSKAALQCNISQSSMTIALRGIEEDLGVTLFERRARGIRLTEPGERFLRHAHTVMAAYTRALEDMTLPRDRMLSGTLRIGVTQTISAYLMPAVLAEASQRLPQLTLNIVELGREQVERGLVDGELDLGLLIVSNLTRFDELECDTVLRSPRRLWTHPDHPLRAEREVRLSQVARHDYVLLNMDEHLETVDKYWGRLGLRPTVRYQSASPESVRSLVSLQKGVTILSDLLYRPWSLEGRRIARRDVVEPIPTMDIGSVWRRDNAHAPMLQALVQFFRAVIKV